MENYNSTDQQKIIHKILNSSNFIVVLAIFLSLLLGALFAAFFNVDVQESLKYIVYKPSDFLYNFTNVLSNYFSALIRGAIYDYHADSVLLGLVPLCSSLTSAVPLIFTGLSVAIAFRAGLFNIGAQGQLTFSAILVGYVGINWHLPIGIHLFVAIIVAIIGGMLWGFIPGILKAKLNANEVIITIMLNAIAFFLLDYILKKQVFIGQSGYPGKSLGLDNTAVYPTIFGDNYYLHAGFIFSILTTIFIWWLLERSTFGFKLKAIGANKNAALTAGMSANKTIVLTMLISGGLAGLACTGPVLGTEKFLSIGVASSFGFTGITVALLGKAKPFGTFCAGLLFGALNSAAASMQAAANIPVDVIEICQAIIVLLIAAPPLVRYIFRLPNNSIKLIKS